MTQWKRPLNRRRFVGIGGSSLAALYLAACGGDSSNDEGASGAQSTASQGVQNLVPTAADTAQAQRGGTLAYHGANADFPDIHQATHSGITGMMQYPIDGLTQLDEPKPGEFTEAAMLAAVPERPDDLTLVYKLRPGVKFANVPPVNGRALTAEDAKFSLERMATDDPKFLRRSWFAGVERFEAVDASTLKVVTKEPVASLSTLIANPWTGIIAKEQVERDGAQLKDLIGSGPYITSRLDINSQIDFRRNPDYWDSGKPYFDEVKLLYLPEPAARVAAFRSGQISRVDPPADTVENFKQTNPNAIEYKVLTPGIGIVAFNNRREPYNDPRVRQAIATAVDLQGWIDVIVAGQGLLTGPMSPAYANWALPEDKLLYTKPDIAKAKQLLAAAGYADGFKMNAFSIGDVQTYIAQAEQMKEDLRPLGIDVQIEAVTQQDYTRRLFTQRDFDVVTGQDFAPDDPDRLRDKLHSKGSGNYAGYANPEVDSLLERQTVTIDRNARKQLVNQAQEIILRDVPILFSIVWYTFYFTKPNLHNWRESVLVGNGTRWSARNAFMTQ
ncbi:MAG: ABC transporter substrate-binding protein [Dehalococcoidia bacterium]